MPKRNEDDLTYKLADGFMQACVWLAAALAAVTVLACVGALVETLLTGAPYR